jgi:single stranded DNA-binding protein (ssb)
VAGFNKVVLLGNLTRNPELRYTPNGTPVASLGLAVSRRYKQGDELKEEVCFVDIVVFGKQAEHCGQYLSKGTGSSSMGGCSSADGKQKTARSAASTKWWPKR